MIRVAVRNTLDSPDCVLQGSDGSFGIESGVVSYDSETRSALTPVLETDTVLVVPVIAHGFEVVFVELFEQP